MNKQKILEEFGRKYTEEVYFNGVQYAMGFFELGKMSAPAYVEIMSKIAPVIERLTPEEKDGFLLLFKDVITNTMFSAMNIFDVEKSYKLIYVNEKGEVINLQEVAEENDYGNGFLNGEVYNWINETKND